MEFIVFLMISMVIVYFVIFGSIAWFSARMLPDLSGRDNNKVRERPETTVKREE